jgi:membrane protein
MRKKRLHTLYFLIKKSFSLFNDNNGLKLSASLSYYTVFSIIPFLIILISLAGIFLGKKEVEGKVFAQISKLAGNEGAVQVREIMRNIQQSHHGTIGSIIGFIILLIGASGVFSEIQESINHIWTVDNKPKQSWSKYVIKKLLSFSLIAGMSFILMVSLLVNAALDIFSAQLNKRFPDYSVHLFYVLNIAIIIVVITGLFAIIFKVLPNAIISWKDAMAGAIFTAILFIAGKFLIGFYLGNSSIGAMYGAAASILIFMLWVYYSSIILYLGAAFTKAFAMKHGRIIQTK